MKINSEKKKSIIEKQNLTYRQKVSKNKKNILKSIIKELKTTSKKIYWKFSFNISYFYKSSIFSILKKDIKINKISILIPTRERALKFERFISSIIENTQNIKRCEILVLIDDDDPEKNNYLKLIDELKKKVDIKMYNQNLNTHAKRNNFLAKVSSGQILFPANDDMIFVTKNWDYLLDVEFSKNSKNKPFCVWVNSGNKYPYLFCHFPIINRVWYNTLGYVGCELFNFWYLDTWICDLAKRSNQFIYSSKIKFKEFNAQSNIEELDNTYLRNISDNKLEKDIEIWEKSIYQRINEAKKLKRAL